MELKHTKISLYLDYYGSLLTERRQQILHMVYDDDLSLSEIADEFSISRQAVHDNVQHGVKQLEEYEASLGMVEKNLKLTASIDDILQDKKTLDDDLIQKLENLKSMIL